MFEFRCAYIRGSIRSNRLPISALYFFKLEHFNKRKINNVVNEQSPDGLRPIQIDCRMARVLFL